MKKYFAILISLASIQPALAQVKRNSVSYKIETSGTVSDGKFAPLWLTANRYGLGSERSKNGFVRAGVFYKRDIGRDWSLDSGIDIAGGAKLSSDFWLQQAFVDISWKKLELSFGSKERAGGPMEKNPLLTSGWMVEGNNIRPIPQLRFEIKEYCSVPGTRDWLAMKGHIAYGVFTDGKWQRNFVDRGNDYTEKVLYHSKALMLKLGNKDKFPMEFEFGMISSAQFGGNRMKKNMDGSVSLIQSFPYTLKDFWRIFMPKRDDSLSNVQGNHCGSWNFGLSYFLDEWMVRCYLEHYFEDHSQMFWEYGRWKDGHLGIEVSFPENRWVKGIVWEGLNTTDQTGPILYDGIAGSFEDLQMSGGDRYYTNGQYLGWQNYGAVIGHPFLLGPQYNSPKVNKVRSSRAKAQHIGINGSPSKEWNWRVLMSFYRHWGTYGEPFDCIKKQFSGLAEVSYSPTWLSGWKASAAIAVDRGKYPGNSTGFMLSVSKNGTFWF